QDFRTSTGVHRAVPDLSEKPPIGLAIGIVPAGDIHGHVGIKKDSHPRPASISASICSMSPVGAPRRDSRSSGSPGLTVHSAMPQLTAGTTPAAFDCRI